jgi:hypothetical protein
MSSSNKYVVDFEDESEYDSDENAHLVNLTHQKLF